MSTLRAILTNISSIMDLSALNIVMAIGIVVMLIGIYRSGSVIDKLKQRNARDRKRELHQFSEDSQKLAHH